MYKFRMANIIGFFILDNTDLEQQLPTKSSKTLHFPAFHRTNTFRSTII